MSDPPVAVRNSPNTGSYERKIVVSQSDDTALCELRSTVIRDHLLSADAVEGMEVFANDPADGHAHGALFKGHAQNPKKRCVFQDQERLNSCPESFWGCKC